MIHFLQLLLLLSGYPHPPNPCPHPPNHHRRSPLVTIKGIVLDSSTNKPIGLVTLTLTDSLTGETVRSSVVVKQEIDRISYDVQADPDSKANDALEMLRKVPMVTVDANDVVQLKGSNNFRSLSTANLPP
jgi:hypothetical protein